MTFFGVFAAGWGKHGAAVMTSSVLISFFVLFTYRSMLQRLLWENVETHHHTPKASSSGAKNELISPEFDVKSCISRYQSPLHNRSRLHTPSPYLISKLRNYEARLKRCGLYTDLYNKSLEAFGSGLTTPPNVTSECKYIISITFNGMGNKIISLAATFIYALITDRVLLIDPGNDLPELFCEPFPGVSWVLPSDFPQTNQPNSFNQKIQDSFGNIMKNNLSISYPYPPQYLYAHLSDDSNDDDKLFFCSRQQSFLHAVQWLVIKSDQYFVPSLFMIQPFDLELNRLFPDKEAVFHLIGRYLFNPTNRVWGLISRFYDAYLSNADERVGIQLRILEPEKYSPSIVMNHILSCSMTQGILPQINNEEQDIDKNKKKRSIALLITTLTRGYCEELRNMYFENPTTTGEVVAVHQPSFEEYQKFDNRNHDMKAWVDIYLLSLTDRLITTAWSTFGYVAQGLGGLRPWILNTMLNWNNTDQKCERDMSMEPCFHHPPVLDCETRQRIEPGGLVPHIKACKDIIWGIKLFGPHKDVDQHS